MNATDTFSERDCAPFLHCLTLERQKVLAWSVERVPLEVLDLLWLLQPPLALLLLPYLLVAPARGVLPGYQQFSAN